MHSEHERAQQRRPRQSESAQPSGEAGGHDAQQQRAHCAVQRDVPGVEPAGVTPSCQPVVPSGQVKKHKLRRDLLQNKLLRVQNAQFCQLQGNRTFTDLKVSTVSGLYDL